VDYFEMPSRRVSGDSVENHENSQDNRPPFRHLNTEFHEEEARGPIIRPKSQIYEVSEVF